MPSSTRLPRSSSSSSRSLRGATRIIFALAFACMSLRSKFEVRGSTFEAWVRGTSNLEPRTSRSSPAHLRGLIRLARVPAEGPRRRELAEPMAHHVLRDQHRHVPPAVVHRDDQSHHVRHHRRGARPGADRLPLPAAHHGLDLLHQALFDEGPLLRRSAHLSLRSVSRRGARPCALPMPHRGCDPYRGARPCAPTSSAAARCTCPCACCCACGSRAPACPTGSSGRAGPPAPCLRRRRAGGPPDSSPSRAPSGG